MQITESCEEIFVDLLILTLRLEGRGDKDVRSVT